ncbi:MAG: hypothetical protein ABIK53_06590 [bacterium]
MSIANPKINSNKNGSCGIVFNPKTGRLIDKKGKTVYADKPYSYAVTLSENNRLCRKGKLSHMDYSQDNNQYRISGGFKNCTVEFVHQLLHKNGNLEEVITLTNNGTTPLEIRKVEFGFNLEIGKLVDWRLCAVPLRVQLDGKIHDYSTHELTEGKFTNSVYADSTRPEPPLAEEGILRSEAWAWFNSKQGLLIVKYNPEDIEHSIVCPYSQKKENYLRFGGVGLCLYSEPSAALSLAPGQSFSFGPTTYISFRGGLTSAYLAYRTFLESKGHGLPKDYNPPVNWNELYDIGWYHSNKKKLKKKYTREALLAEAAKAKECGCELLYLDPGWEIAEGTTLWDKSRLGEVKDLVKILKEKYGLELGYRTMLRCYRKHWPNKWLVLKKTGAGRNWIKQERNPRLYELCLCNKDYWQEKLKRILDISQQGVRFMMFDEMDWRGPCWDPKHNHSIPTTVLDHVQAVYELCAAVRKHCPDILIECHDPVWSWHNCIYVPTYFGQGFGKDGFYQENWGFEYMWNCIDDLKTGKALSLYYYNLGCPIPLYLHINMTADNDQCLFFWWAASTVRHLGIGGKKCGQGVHAESCNPEKRFRAYQKQMNVYKQLKPYFVRGSFYGISEHIHLHTLPSKRGGVLNVFNLKEKEQSFRFSIPSQLLNTKKPLPVEGARAIWKKGGEVEFSLCLPAMAPAIIYIRDSA